MTSGKSKFLGLFLHLLFVMLAFTIFQALSPRILHVPTCYNPITILLSGYHHPHLTTEETEEKSNIASVNWQSMNGTQAIWLQSIVS